MGQKLEGTCVANLGWGRAEEGIRKKKEKNLQRDKSRQVHPTAWQLGTRRIFVGNQSDVGAEAIRI